MVFNNGCALSRLHSQPLMLHEALARIPGPQGERFAELFKHGTLSVEYMRPVVPTRNSRIPGMRRILSYAGAASSSSAIAGRGSDLEISFSPLPGLCTALKISRTI
jgi:hypothetical protein